MQPEDLNKFKWFHCDKIDSNLNIAHETAIKDDESILSPPLLLLTSAVAPVLNHFRHGDFYVKEVTYEVVKPNENKLINASAVKLQLPQQKSIHIQKFSTLNSAHSMPNLSNKLGKQIFIISDITFLNNLLLTLTVKIYLLETNVFHLRLILVPYEIIFDLNILWKQKGNAKKKHQCFRLKNGIFTA
jgi:hypothetical protein